jgi:Uma2 family endonuclease
MNAQVQIDRFKLTVESYHRMIEAGVFGPDDRVELIEGELIAMVPPKPAHADYVDVLGAVLRRCTKLTVRVQNPITLPEHSEPQPDIALVASRRYRDSHPLPDDIQLVIEVSDASLGKDKQIKLPLYARYGLPEVWILDVVGRAMECYWDPQEGRYAKSSRTTQGVLVSPTQSEITIDLDALWDQN